MQVHFSSYAMMEENHLIHINKKLRSIFQDIICFLTEEKEDGQDYETVLWASRDSS